jgi:hypothetical protein
MGIVRIDQQENTLISVTQVLYIVGACIYAVSQKSVLYPRV